MIFQQFLRSRLKEGCMWAREVILYQSNPVIHQCLRNSALHIRKLILSDLISYSEVFLLLLKLGTYRTLHKTQDKIYKLQLT